MTTHLQDAGNVHQLQALHFSSGLLVLDLRSHCVSLPHYREACPPGVVSNPMYQFRFMSYLFRYRKRLASQHAYLDTCKYLLNSADSLLLVLA